MKPCNLLVAAVVSVVICVTGSYGKQPERKPEAKVAKGVVFHDANGNRKYDEGEKPLPGMRVSNGRDVVTTDSAGRYRIPVGDDTIIFVIKPRGWRSPLSKTNLPRFYYIYKPHGSPKSRFPGAAPTGPLPKSVDFPLYPQNEPDKYKMLVFADTQTYDRRDVAYLAHDVVEELIGTDAAFGVTLGDIVFNDLSILEPETQVVSKVGIPWHNVIGNHDMNYDARQLRYTDETFERLFGPSHYSFNYGPTHFIVLDDVCTVVDKQTKETTWGVGMGNDQIEFIKNDLAGVPQETLVVLMMHVPILEIPARQSIYRLIENRPHCFSMSGHTHTQEHYFIGPKDGWRGPQPHHHYISGAACGCWWHGCPDERGIPNATMSDGTPNGYSIITFDGNKYTQEYRAAGRSKDYQMQISAPDELPLTKAAKTKVLANVFNGSARSIVRMRIDEGRWIEMKREPLIDPALRRAWQIDEKLEEEALAQSVEAIPVNAHLDRAAARRHETRLPPHRGRDDRRVRKEVGRLSVDKAGGKRSQAGNRGGRRRFSATVSAAGGDISPKASSVPLPPSER